IISHILKKDKAWVLSHLDDSIENDIARKIKDLINKRKSGYPLAYIVNKKEFMGLDFHVEEGIFIPRPETETLVQIAIEYIKNNSIKTVAETGCGSGAIAVSIAYYSKAKIYATDISQKAVNVTAKNTKKHGVNRLVNVKQGEFLEPFKDKLDEIELVVSNPPYVEPEFRLPEEALFEPKEAFFYGESSLDFYKEFKQRYFGKNWTVIMEFSGKEEDKKVIKNLFQDVGFIKDLDGIERFFIGRV
ncbi:MAG: peptide chain release factor N(5)-glutamine methyltransferase, partial [Thermotogaceae bacterium]|nr:peptide chain release factor N(5)-glutamine methyltransferase [Thermotogaceae bacterium]